MKIKARKFLTFLLAIAFLSSPVFLLNLTTQMHHVSYGQLGESLDILSKGHISGEGFRMITPAPFLWGAIILMMFEGNLLLANIIFTFLLLFSLFTLSIAITSSLYARSSKLIVVITSIMGIMGVQLYPSVTYEFGFHHQWFGIMLFAYFAYVFFRLILGAVGSAHPAILALLAAVISLAHPFTALHVILFLLSYTFLALYNKISLKTIYIVLPLLSSILSIIYNEIFLLNVKRDYIPLISSLQLVISALKEYTSIVMPPRTTSIFSLIASYSIKTYVTLITFISLILFVHSRKVEKRHLYRATLFTVSLVGTVIFFIGIGLTMYWLSMAFTERWLWHLSIPISYVIALLFEEKSSKRLIIHTLRIFMIALSFMLMLTSPVATLENVPLRDYYAIYSSHSVALTSTLQHVPQGSSLSITPGYYILGHMINANLNGVALYVYKPLDKRLAVLEDVNIVILSNGLKLQLGVFAEAWEDVVRDLINLRDIVYADGDYQIAYSS